MLKGLLHDVAGGFGEERRVTLLKEPRQGSAGLFVAGQPGSLLRSNPGR